MRAIACLLTCDQGHQDSGKGKGQNKVLHSRSGCKTNLLQPHGFLKLLSVFVGFVIETRLHVDAQLSGEMGNRPGNQFSLGR